MKFCGRFAAPMFCPIHAIVHQPDDGRVHGVHTPLKAPQAPGAPAKLRAGGLQVGKNGPKELLRHFGIAHFIGVRESIGTGSNCPAKSRKRTAEKTQRITHVVETYGMSELRVDQGNHMAPRSKGSRLLLHTRRSGQFRNQMRRNPVANLAKNFKSMTALAWIVFFHLLCVEQSKLLANAFLYFPVVRY